VTSFSLLLILANIAFFPYFLPAFESYPGRSYKSDVAAPNPLYNMHVNAATGSGHSGHEVLQPSPMPSPRVMPTAFYPPHLAQHSHSTGLSPPMRPSTSFIGVSPSLPSILMPGGGLRARREAKDNLESSLLFQHGSGPGLPSTSLQHPEEQLSYSHRRSSSPNLPRPALPPKPPSFPNEGRGSVSPKVPRKSHSLGISGSPIDSRPGEDEELARALAISLQNSSPSPRDIQEQEEDVLARVIAESLAAVSPEPTPSGSIDSPSPLLNASASSSSLLPSSNLSPNPIESPSPSVDSNSSFAPSRITPNHSSAGKRSENEADLLLDEEEARRRKQLADDEEFARALLREEARFMSSDLSEPQAMTPIGAPASVTIAGPSAGPLPRLPLYEESVASAMAGRPTSFHPMSLPSSPATTSQLSHYSDPASPMGRSDAPSVPPKATRPRAQSRGAEGANANPVRPGENRVERSTSAQAAIPTVNRIQNHGGIGAHQAPDPPAYMRPNSVIPASQTSDPTVTSGSPVTPMGQRPQLTLNGIDRLPSSGRSGSTDEGEGSAADGASPLTPDSATSPSRDEGRLVAGGENDRSPMVDDELLWGVCESHAAEFAMLNLSILIFIL
jgi:hypothetical protein